MEGGIVNHLNREEQCPMYAQQQVTHDMSTYSSLPHAVTMFVCVFVTPHVGSIFAVEISYKSLHHMYSITSKLSTETSCACMYCPRNTASCKCMYMYINRITILFTPDTRTSGEVGIVTSGGQSPSVQVPPAT